MLESRFNGILIMVRMPQAEARGKAWSGPRHSRIWYEEACLRHEARHGQNRASQDFERRIVEAF